MPWRKNRNCKARPEGAAASRLPWKPRWGRALACLAAMAAFAGAVSFPGQNSPQTQQPSLNPDKPYLSPEANRLPDVNRQMEMREQQTRQQNFAAANAERRKQISDDTARLLKMAADLKAEVDKTSKDTLSINVIRKADEIEKLAHIVKEKMKLTVGQG